MQSNAYALIPQREPEELLSEIIEEELAAIRIQNYDEIPPIDLSEEIQQTSQQDNEYLLIPKFRTLTVTENNFKNENQENVQNYEFSQNSVSNPVLNGATYALSLNDEAVEQGNIGNFEQAMALFFEAIAYDSSNPDIHFNRGVANRSWCKFEDAIKDFDEALKLNAGHVGARYQRGFCYFELKKYHEAKEDFTATIEKDPNHVWAFYLRGRIYVAIKKYNRAKKDFQETKRLATIQKDETVINLANKMLAQIEEKLAKKQKKSKSFLNIKKSETSSETKQDKDKVITIKESYYLQEKAFYLQKIAELEEKVKKLKKELKKK